MNIIPGFLRGALQLATWQNCMQEMPPDDYTPIELRFNQDPVPLITNGRTVRKIWEHFGRPPVPCYWRLLVKQ